MSLAVIYSRALVGIEAIPIEVEVFTSNGLPGISIVGLPEAAVRESKDRVHGAVLNCGFKIPYRRITINLAPADLPKEGGRYDLPIAIGFLIASNQLKVKNLANYEFIGELALSGNLRPINGVLPSLIATKANNRVLIIPEDNKVEAGIITKAKVLSASNLLEVCTHLSGISPLPQVKSIKPNQPKYLGFDFSEVKGQDKAKRALEIAATGGHNVLMVGPPGTGKTMLASRLPSILPPLSEAEAIETAKIYSIRHSIFNPKNWLVRPMRAPHHTASAVALVGGGSVPKPGEISLAHNGVLFLDELPEFDRKVLEVLREPLESGEIRISRATQQAEFHADFLLVASMNPCPCGYFGDGTSRCKCTDDQISRYRNKISGPLLDRIDIHIEVPKVPVEDLQNIDFADKNNSSSKIRSKVIQARKLQYNRQNKANYQLNGKEISKFCFLGEPENQLLSSAMEKLSLSARSYFRILRVARTIADLDNKTHIRKNHIAEAISYRMLDRAI